MLTDEERIAVARAAWRFRSDNRFPAEVLCEMRGKPLKTDLGAESLDSMSAWREIAAALGLTPTAYSRRLLVDPRLVAADLLRPLDLTPESLGWE